MQIYSKDRRRLKLIACEVFVRSSCLAIATSPHTVDPVFTPKAAHDAADHLRTSVQQLIDEADEAGIYDGILIGMGLCGNGIVGLAAPSIPLIVPRAHDCCTIFLGSKEEFYSSFSHNLSAEWSSPGYMERGDGYLRESEIGANLGLNQEYDELVEQYGEENAKYVWETLHPPTKQTEVIFIDDPENPIDSFEDEAKDAAEGSNLDFRIIHGNMRLIRKLIHGEWDEEEFQVVPPAGKIRGVYDRNEIIGFE